MTGKEPLRWVGHPLRLLHTKASRYHARSFRFGSVR